MWSFVISKMVGWWSLLWNLRLRDMSTTGLVRVQSDKMRGLKSATLHSWIWYSSASCCTTAPNGSFGRLYLDFTKKPDPMIAFTWLQGLLLTLAQYLRICSSRRRSRGSTPASCSNLWDAVLGRALRAIVRALRWIVFDLLRLDSAAQDKITAQYSIFGRIKGLKEKQERIFIWSETCDIYKYCYLMIGTSFSTPLILHFNKDRCVGHKHSALSFPSLLTRNVCVKSNDSNLICFIIDFLRHDLSCRTFVLSRLTESVFNSLFKEVFIPYW